MQSEPYLTPSRQDVITIVRSVCGQDARSVQRFATGLCHYVYDVVLDDGQRLVARIAGSDTQSLLAGGVRWSSLLRPRGVPLPALLHVDLDATVVPFAYVLLEHLPGTDLGHVYHGLTWKEKRAMAAEIVRIQRVAHALPPGRRYGYVTSPDEVPSCATWTAVVEQSLDEALETIGRVGVVEVRDAERLRQRLVHYRPYLDQVAPTPFLDDTTTKNVLVHNGRLSGIVDVDEVCYGDPIWVVALTQMALLKPGKDTDYITAWVEHLALSPEQRRVLQFYTAIFCTIFMGELGQAFNKDAAEPVDQAVVAHLTRVLNDLLAMC